MSKRWIKLSFRDPKLNELPGAEEWLREVEEIINKELEATARKLLAEGPVIGDGPTLIEYAKEHPLPPDAIEKVLREYHQLYQADEARKEKKRITEGME